jgi:hypothetical protein
MALTTPLLSPGIAIREFDLTGIAPNVETSLAAFVGDFMWGPVGEPIRIQNEGELAEIYGTPDEFHAVDYFSANQFLRYSGNLIINRAIPVGSNLIDKDSALNGSNAGLTAAGAKIKIVVKNREDWEAQTTIANSFTAKYPGAMGNSLKISVFSQSNGKSVAEIDSDFRLWKYADKFETAPGTSTWLVNQPGVFDSANSTLNSNKCDEIHVAIIDSDGLFSGTKGTLLETYAYVSVAPAGKTTDGGDNYVKNVINISSKYVWFQSWADAALPSGSNWDTNPPLTGTGLDYRVGVAWTPEDNSSAMSGGQDGGFGAGDQGLRNRTGMGLDEGDYEIGFDLFEDPDTTDVQLLIAPGMSTKTPQKTVIANLVGIAGKIRKDCLAVSSPDRAAVVNNANPVSATLATTDEFPSSSYLAVDNNYLRVYDKFNDQYIYIPAASSTAGLMAYTDYNYGPWWSPAGEKRGEYVGVTNLAYSPTRAERDSLYKRNVNPIVTYPNRGTLLWGDKTKLSRPSAFDRIGVRRLFLAIEKSVALAARNFLFEINDEFTRSEFVAVVEPLLREIQSRRGIFDYRVQCDDTNNTPEVIDRNEMKAALYIKPARSINFITIDFIATRTGADFDEIIGSGLQF